MIVPFNAGGTSDRLARTIDEFWIANGKQSFNFQYFPGADGLWGTSKMALSAALSEEISLRRAQLWPFSFPKIVFFRAAVGGPNGDWSEGFDNRAEQLGRELGTGPVCKVGILWQVWYPEEIRYF